ncbi:gp53-like domain-containing protein [Citrobacter portucalensis]|uniref:gp53-like domain-containing protein n=1 Tax=Citrobacter portucalensis TaxID=1639133 RepID=UPI00226AFF39|nr:hypothetical protein [Citrobacter portucalensis]MCX8985982.1 hypothetical protein [Citrobacter portucalensis]
MLRIGQVESSSTDDGKYTDGSVAGGIAATRLRAAAFNAIQEELAHIVESTGVVLDIDDTTQVLSALNKIFAGYSDALGALSALTGAANKLPYFTGQKSASLADLTAFAREILAQTDAAGVLTKLGLGGIANAADITAATPNKLIDAYGLNSYFPSRRFGPSGYIRIPNQPGGLILQWGPLPIIPAGGSVVVRYGFAFPESFLAVIPMAGSSSAAANSVLSAGGGDSKVTFQVFNSLPGVTNGTGEGIYIALGF